MLASPKVNHLAKHTYPSLWKRAPKEKRPTVFRRIPEDMADSILEIALIIDKHPDRAIALQQLLAIAKTL